MRTYRFLLFGLLVGVCGLAVSSCAYDPYYSGGATAVRYGQGQGFGNPNFSTSFFVRTGNARWGYDPRVRCYYDFNRRAYYDPFLYGYYPVGFRPQLVRGVPHPHGWRNGRQRIAPPSRILFRNLPDHRNRAVRYRNLNRDWSRNIRIQQNRNANRGSNARDETRLRNRDRREQNLNRQRRLNQQNSFRDRNRDVRNRDLSRNDQLIQQRRNLRKNQASSAQRQVQRDREARQINRKNRADRQRNKANSQNRRARNTARPDRKVRPQKKTEPVPQPVQRRGPVDGRRSR